MAATFKNNVTIVGTLEDLDLQVYEGTSKSSGEAFTAIRGNYTIKSGEQNVNLEAFYMEKFGSGKTNPNFGIVKRWLDDPDSAIGKDFRISTAIDENSFMAQDGSVVKGTKIRAGFIDSRNVGRPEAKFVVDMLMESEPYPEIRDEEETGRYLMNVKIFNYQNMAYPARFVLGSEAAYEFYVSLEASKSNPVLIQAWGNVINNTIETKKVEESAFGEPRVEIYTTSRRENVITGGHSEPRELTEDIAKLIKDGIAAYDVRLAQLESQANQPVASSAKQPTVKDTGKKFQF